MGNVKTGIHTIMQLVENPSRKHIGQIRSWLKVEYIIYQEGFFCNWNIIYDSYEKRRLFCLIDNGIAVGFVTWFKCDRIVEIEIAEVKRELRGHGFGRYMIERISQIFSTVGCVAFSLQCSPSTSESFWSKLGFISYSDDYSTTNQKMYKCLVKTMPFADYLNEGESNPIIELWDCEPHLAIDREPKWRWIIKFDKETTKLEYPIVIPCNDNWNIRYRHGNSKIENKVKRFIDHEIHFDKFMIIEEFEKHCP